MVAVAVSSGLTASFLLFNALEWSGFFALKWSFSVGVNANAVAVTVGIGPTADFFFLYDAVDAVDAVALAIERSTASSLLYGAAVDRSATAC